MNHKKAQKSLNGLAGWGGKRKNSGRPNKTGTVGHAKRPRVTAKNPLHLNLKLVDGLPSLRSKALLREFHACCKGATRWGLNVAHFSIQNNHIHLIVEAKDNKALALGMRSLIGRFAKIIRAYASSKGRPSHGSVFRGRYHLHVLKTPTEVKNALRYVLLNYSRHQSLIPFADEFSPAALFRYWPKLLGQNFEGLIKSDYEFFQKHKPPPGLLEATTEPQSWLLTKGWMRAI